MIVYSYLASAFLLLPSLRGCRIMVTFGLGWLERKTIGKTSRELLSGASTTNYDAITISTTTTTYRTDQVSTDEARALYVSTPHVEMQGKTGRSTKFFANLLTSRAHRRPHAGAQRKMVN